MALIYKDKREKRKEATRLIPGVNIPIPYTEPLRKSPPKKSSEKTKLSTEEKECKDFAENP